MSTADSIVINRLLTFMAEYRSSDLHLSVGNLPIMRIDGVLTPLTSEAVLTQEFMEKFARFILPPDKFPDLEKKKELMITWGLEGKARFRIHFFYQDSFLSASLRYVPERIKSLRELGLPDDIIRIVDMKEGLVIFNGPVGSGKTTTVASVIDFINQSQSRHIITLEQSIEYIFADAQCVIDQREVGRDVESIASGLDHFVAEDVDIFFVDRPRDIFSWEAILRTSRAGHLVFVTLETHSTFAALQSIIHAFPPERQPNVRNELSDALAGAITQKLIPKVGGGRVPVVEILFPTPALRSILRDGELYQINNVLQTSRGDGMISFDRSLASMVQSGVISEETALSYAFDRNNLKMLLQ